MTDTQTDVYYDPYDWAIDTDPYPVFKRMRDEAPLYYASQLAVSRPPDRGTPIQELIKEPNPNCGGTSCRPALYNLH